MAIDDRLQDAISSLLPHHQGEVTKETLIKALLVAAERRKRNTRDGGAVIEALRELHGMSYRDIEEAVGGEVSKSAAQRWASPPE